MGLIALWYVGIFPDQGMNQCSLYCKVASQPLDHNGSLVKMMTMKGFARTREKIIAKLF